MTPQERAMLCQVRDLPPGSLRSVASEIDGHASATGANAISLRVIAEVFRHLAGVRERRADGGAA